VDADPTISADGMPVDEEIIVTSGYLIKTIKTFFFQGRAISYRSGFYRHPYKEYPTALQINNG